MLKSAAIALSLSLILLHDASAFSLPFLSAATTAVAPAPEAPVAKNVVTKVAVAGATGRTGRYVVEELLKRNVQVVAMVRDTEKAEQVFSTQDGLDVLKVDLTAEKQIDAAVSDCDAAIWCATGFSDSPDSSLVDRVKKLVGIAVLPQKSIDAVGIPALAKSLADSPTTSCPKVVMLSSAGVTRPSWSDAKKSLFPGSADIPIVRLNPFGILDIKAASEEELRQSGTDYCIVRPAGLNDNWPSGSRPVFSQGDVAVGRINRKDVAKILVDVLSTPEATGKTFEAITLADYPPAGSIEDALSKLKNDSDGLPSLDVICGTYNVMQQMLPGEKQDSAGLAMGQTYEQLDKNEEGRFGKRGEENLKAVPMKPTRTL